MFRNAISSVAWRTVGSGSWRMALIAANQGGLSGVATAPGTLDSAEAEVQQVAEVRSANAMVLGRQIY